MTFRQMPVQTVFKTDEKYFFKNSAVSAIQVEKYNGGSWEIVGEAEPDKNWASGKQTPLEVVGKKQELVPRY